VLYVTKGGQSRSRLSPSLCAGPPTVTPGYLERYAAQEGDHVKLACPIAANPKPIIEWYQDDHLIPHSWDRFRVRGKHMKIRGARVADSGVFVCKGVNGFGSAEVEINLVVRGE